MAGPKRPRDPNQLAKLIVDIATGEVEDTLSEEKRRPRKRKGRVGGLKGGKARASALSAEHRSAISRKAALVRWHQKQK